MHRYSEYGHKERSTRNRFVPYYVNLSEESGRAEVDYRFGAGIASRVGWRILIDRLAEDRGVRIYIHTKGTPFHVVSF